MTLWRELRRLGGDDLQGELKALWEAANAGDWAQFVQLMGGTAVSRKDLPIKLAKQWDDKPNRYQEPIGERLVGIEYQNFTIPTRIHRWVIQFKGPKRILPAAYTAEGATEATLANDRVGLKGEALLEFCQ